mmetsp:Transcript_127862/g.355822  ORF Transcript_127862/g.355822 Transcript_127862/m.355822 type:complete len:223 (+) Transcript_127862:97-765(+)
MIASLRCGRAPASPPSGRRTSPTRRLARWRGLVGVGLLDRFHRSRVPSCEHVLIEQCLVPPVLLLEVLAPMRAAAILVAETVGLGEGPRAKDAKFLRGSSNKMGHPSSQEERGLGALSEVRVRRFRLVVILRALEELQHHLGANEARRDAEGAATTTCQLLVECEGHADAIRLREVIEEVAPVAHMVAVCDLNGNPTTFSHEEWEKRVAGHNVAVDRGLQHL